MHQNENGEYVLSRREYTQLAAAVPASHATGDDGWFSGLFGGSDNDGPGLFEDVEYRHEDSHIITDPKVIDFVGDAINIERPNEYDEAVRLRVSGDLVVEGEDIEPASVTTPSVATDSLSNIADHVVGSKSELQSAFNNISTGETIWVGRPATPYRTDQWLDINADGVTVVFQSPFAEDGSPIVKVADGANVGGIRVGPGSTTISDVTIRGLGYHGNDLNQDNTVKRLHGVILDNTEDCRVEKCFATRTHPYHEHNTGGSGVSATARSTGFWINKCWFDDIGDRGVQAGGDGGYITQIVSRNGFDRCVGLNMQEDDGSDSAASNIIVNGVDGRDNTEGSIVGGGQGGTTGQYIISNVLGRGTYRSVLRYNGLGPGTIKASNIMSVGSGVGVRMTNTPDKVLLTNVYSEGQIEITGDRCVMSNINVVGSGKTGVLIDGGSKFYASDIHIDNPGGEGLFNRGADSILVNGLFVRGAATKGLADNDTGTHQRFLNVDISGSTNEDVHLRGATGTSVSGVWDTVTDQGTRSRLNGIGSESANAETPTPGNWHSGEIVDFTDSGDGSGTDRYIRLPVTHASDWIRMSDAALV